MKFQEMNEFVEESFEKRMKRIDLEEMKWLKKVISTPASDYNWIEVKQIYQRDIQ